MEVAETFQWRNLIALFGMSVCMIPLGGTYCYLATAMWNWIKDMRSKKAFGYWDLPVTLLYLFLLGFIPSFFILEMIMDSCK